MHREKKIIQGSELSTVSGIHWGVLEHIPCGWGGRGNYCMSVFLLQGLDTLSYLTLTIVL